MATGHVTFASLPSLPPMLSAMQLMEADEASALTTLKARRKGC
jgi:hypothetical protein